MRAAPPEPLPLNKAVLTLGTEVVVVIGGNKDAFGVAVVEDCDGLVAAKLLCAGFLPCAPRRFAGCPSTSE